MRSKTLGLASLIVVILSSTSLADLRIGDFCRVKGQEENTLHGLGLIVGLNGTGGSDTATKRALAKLLENMRNPIAKDPRGNVKLDELKDVKNTALVFVTATVPAQGARQGDKLHCVVHSFGKVKSLKGGYLLMTPLVGPSPSSKARKIYALAQGRIRIETGQPETTGKIFRGCRLERSFRNEFVKNDKIILLLDKNHASFQRAYDVAQQINDIPDFINRRKRARSAPNYRETKIARAVDSIQVEVKIPPKYKSDPVLFVSAVLNERILLIGGRARVVINQSEGVVVIGERVRIDPVAITYKNINVQAGGGNGPNAGGATGPQFQTIDPNGNGAQLKTLVAALNALKVSPKDIIQILKSLKTQGALYGKLIIE